MSTERRRNRFDVSRLFLSSRFALSLFDERRIQIKVNSQEIENIFIFETTGENVSNNATGIDSLKTRIIDFFSCEISIKADAENGQNARETSKEKRDAILHAASRSLSHLLDSDEHRVVRSEIEIPKTRSLHSQIVFDVRQFAVVDARRSADDRQSSFRFFMRRRILRRFVVVRRRTKVLQRLE